METEHESIARSSTESPARSRAREILSGFAPAGRLLLTFGTENEPVQPGWRWAAVWLPVWGLLIGVAYTGVFRIAWLWLGEHQRIRLAPMAMLLAFDAGWLGYRLLAAAAAVVGSWREPVPRAQVPVTLPVMLLIILGLLGKYALLATLPAGNVAYPADWREHLPLIYPYVMYRPLVLMPLWGRWAVLLAAGIGRGSPVASPRMKAMTEGGNRLPVVMGYWAFATALTVLYCSPAGQHVAWSMLISLCMLVAAYLAAFVLVRRFGGQSETTILAVGWATELSFLLFYLPVARSIYWY